MLYLDLAMYLQSLSVETKIIVIQISLLFFELLYFLYLRKYFKGTETSTYKRFRN